MIHLSLQQILILVLSIISIFYWIVQLKIYVKNKIDSKKSFIIDVEEWDIRIFLINNEFIDIRIKGDAYFENENIIIKNAKEIFSSWIQNNDFKLQITKDRWISKFVILDIVVCNKKKHDIYLKK